MAVPLIPSMWVTTDPPSHDNYFDAVWPVIIAELAQEGIISDPMARAVYNVMYRLLKRSGRTFMDSNANVITSTRTYIDLDDYQEFVWTIASEDSKRDIGSQMDTTFYGLMGETGELADHIKKWKFHGHALDKEYVLLELGDILWYSAFGAKAVGLSFKRAVRISSHSYRLENAPKEIARVLPALAYTDPYDAFGAYAKAIRDIADIVMGVGVGIGITFQTIMVANVAKLESRYPGGHFTTERSLNRVEGHPKDIHQPTRHYPFPPTGNPL